MNKKIQQNIKEHWWKTTLFIILILSLLVAGINNPNCNEFIERFSAVCNQLLHPASIVIGTILAYPLLKRKLLGSHISKQFEIIQDTNRKTRKECVLLLEKYPIRSKSHNTTKEFLEDVYNDVHNLYKLTIDGDSEVCKYMTLLHRSLSKYMENVRFSDKGVCMESYKEILGNWVHQHIKNVYNMAISVGNIPNESIIDKKISDDKDLELYISGNQYQEVENLNLGLSFPHHSVKLILFFAINNNVLCGYDDLLLRCCYKSAPSPCPLARLMLQEKIYFPPVLDNGFLWNMFHKELLLVGFQKKYSGEMFTKEDKPRQTYYECWYENFGISGWANIEIKQGEDLGKCTDSYLNLEVRYDGVFNLSTKNDTLHFCISEEAAKKYFNEIYYELQDRLDREMFGEQN